MHLQVALIEQEWPEVLVQHPTCSPVYMLQSYDPHGTRPRTGGQLTLPGFDKSLNSMERGSSYANSGALQTVKSKWSQLVSMLTGSTAPAPSTASAPKRVNTAPAFTPDLMNRAELRSGVGSWTRALFTRTLSVNSDGGVNQGQQSPNRPSTPKASTAATR